METISPIFVTEDEVAMETHVDMTTTISTTTTRRPPEPEEVVADYIWKIGPPVLWIVGTVANILSIIVFSRKGMSSSLTAFFFRVLAVCDLLALQV